MNLVGRDVERDIARDKTGRVNLVGRDVERDIAWDKTGIQKLL